MELLIVIGIYVIVYIYAKKNEQEKVKKKRDAKENIFKDPKLNEIVKEHKEIEDINIYMDLKSREKE